VLTEEIGNIKSKLIENNVIGPIHNRSYFLKAMMFGDSSVHYIFILRSTTVDPFGHAWVGPWS